jgi:NADPH:quinone reductase-like Zn-dependent oxidoreductase
VGSYAVQLAAILGADVAATGRAGQGDFAWSLGARTFTKDARDVRDGFDDAVDTVGGPVLEASYGLTRRGGRLVTLGAPPSAQLARLTELTDSGKLRPVVS